MFFFSSGASLQGHSKFLKNDIPLKILVLKAEWVVEKGKTKFITEN